MSVSDHVVCMARVPSSPRAGSDEIAENEDVVDAYLGREDDDEHTSDAKLSMGRAPVDAVMADVAQVLTVELSSPGTSPKLTS